MAFDIKALAKRINARRQDFNRRYPDRAVVITTAMSRILQHDDDYIPYRPRTTETRRRPETNPRIATLVAIAESLDTTVGDLLGERAFRVTKAERRKLRELVRYLTVLFVLDAPELDEPPFR